MNRQLIWSLGLIGGAILIAALMIALRPEPEEEERPEDAPLVQTAAFEAASGTIPVLGSGTVQARDEVSISAEIPGRLTFVHPSFREGGIVAKGSVLLRIDPSDYENAVRIAQADVAAQDVAVLQAEEEVAIARDELARFSSRVSEEARGESSAILPPRDMAMTDTPQTAQLNENLASREPQLRSAEAARERASAGLADAQLALARTRVLAPFSGLVRTEDAAVGALVQPGQVLGSIVSSTAYEVRISLTADEAALIPGLLNARRARIPASVTFEYGGKTYRWAAFVDRANAILDTATRNVEVFLRVPSPLSSGRLVDGESAANAPPLLLGAFVNAEISGASLDSYAVVPAIAVRPDNEIWVVRNGRLEVLKVSVIQRTDEVAYVTTPSLGDGGRIITSNVRTPIDGMQVRVAQSVSATQEESQQGGGE